MKIIVFGIGDIYSKLKYCFDEGKAEIIALVDNSPKLLGTLIDGYVVDNPKNVHRYQFDYIVITSDYAIEMRQQLIEQGIRQDQIMHYRDYIGSLPVRIPVAETDDLASSVLILSNEFGYHGGPIACMNLARVLRQRGYRITIAVPSAEQDFLEEICLEKGIDVIVVENLTLLSRENLEWARKYTYILANTIVMVQCAIKLSEKRKVYLWLHDSIDSYVGREYWHDEIVGGIENDQLMIGAVSDVARKNFLSIYQTEKKIGLMPYGIDDEYAGNDFCLENKITTFTVIANHVPLKGLDVLLDALRYIPEGMYKQCRFLFAGKTYDNEYGEMVRNCIDKYAGCEYLGELSRKRMFEVYSKTDVVIIPSRRDSLPLIATEAMMMKKPCIISDSIGTTEYVKHKYNGLVFQNENKEELADRICWCLKNKKDLKVIAENARKTYEKWFTVKEFGNRVMKAIECLN